MPVKVLSDTQRTFFDTNGYLVIENALSPGDLEKVQESANKAEITWRLDTSRLGMRSNTIEQVQAPIEYDDILLNLLWHPKVFPTVRELLGNDISMIDNDYFITPPQTPQTHSGWHHDVGLAGVYHPQSTLM